MEKNHQYPHRHHQQPHDFFYVFSQTHPPNEGEPFSNTHHKVQPPSLSPSSYSYPYSSSLYPLSSSSPSSNVVVCTELSLCTSSQTKSNSNRNVHNYGYNPHSSSSSYKKSPNNKGFDNKNDNSQQWGYSTALKLYDDPWKIKKVLTASDLGKLNRLLLGTETMENLLLPVVQNNKNNDEELLMAGKTVRVWDVQTMSMHELVLKRWASFKNYVLIGDWNRDFVRRRALRKGDEIGLHWDSYNHCFNFSVLRRAT